MKSITELGADIQHIIIIDPKIVWIVLIIIWIVFLIISTIILYHWFTYSYTPKITSRVIKIYLIGSSLFIAVGIISTFMYTFST